MSVTVIAGLIAGACLVKRPFEVECHGRLMPTVRREVFAGLEGEIVELLAGESEHVEEGQIIARMQSRDLEKMILEQTGLLKGKLKARDAGRVARPVNLAGPRPVLARSGSVGGHQR